MKTSTTIDIKQIVRNMLIKQERYEDVIKFDRSEKARERFAVELGIIKKSPDNPKADKPKGMKSIEKEINDVDIIAALSLVESSFVTLVMKFVYDTQGGEKGEERKILNEQCATFREYFKKLKEYIMKNK
ncbi:hypothetical protein [Parabacteroides sp. Marseille-P3160]|uniref:hypothetical protein n=1 Tax=Parabacteroides sp. Marseille-P3160 TaxID=1917887 RepID=UPI001118A67A|nr:hypothetical protein [Parabacteroides sp. Marseille-P3160]